MDHPSDITPPAAETCARARVLAYNDAVLRGSEPAGRWIYAAARRFASDLARADLHLDWQAVEQLEAFYASISLVGEASGQPFKLHPWQLWALAQIVGWKLPDGRQRVQLAILQVARGAGKTTLAAGLCLWDMMQGDGRRVHVLANNEDQAEICLDTAKTMAQRLGDESLLTRYQKIVRPSHDCEMSALPALERSLDGLNPSLWVADEAAEFKGRFLTKLLTTGAKRRNSLGLIITTPGSNPETHYAELVKQAEAILSAEIEDDSIMPLLFGLDPSDDLEDESNWPKANPGMSQGQPELSSLRRSWQRMRRSAMGRAEFARYHAARCDENTGGWLDMGQWPGGQTIDWEALAKREAFVGLDLSKSLDMTAAVVAVPLDDGRVALRGHYWWPKADVAQRELDYRYPIRTWAAEGRITLTPGKEIDYDAVFAQLLALKDEFAVRAIGYDKWGTTYLANKMLEKNLPIMEYRMGIATFGPGCQLFQNLWAAGKILIGEDPILRRACAEAHAKRDINGNIRPVKSREYCAIDPLVAAVIACHVWGGQRRSIYQEEYG